MSHDTDDAWNDDLGQAEPPVFSDYDPVTTDTSAPDTLPNELELELRRLRHENERLERKLREVREQNTRLRARLADREAHPDTSTLDDAVHTTLADRFRDLVQQDMQHLVRCHLQSLGGRITPETVAYQVRAVCEELLTGNRGIEQTCQRLGMDPATLGTRMQQLIAKVNILTDQVPPEVWNFQAVTGDRLDPDTQQPWGQCDPRHRVKFVVAPAYQTNGRTYARQQVFTGPNRWWGG